MTPPIIGIDYGAKTAGTTVICYQTTPAAPLQFCSSAKKQDADKFLMEQLIEIANPPQMVFIDAPLSLPGVYTHPQQFDNYFYRAADLQLKAMSPMFLGGLTARAMKLKAQLQTKGIQLIETYPAVHARKWNLKEVGYKKSKQHLESVIEIVEKQTNFTLNYKFISNFNWHYLDAFLAFYGAYRFAQNKSEVFGNETEGKIIV